MSANGAHLPGWVLSGFVALALTILTAAGTFVYARIEGAARTDQRLLAIEERLEGQKLRIDGLTEGQVQLKFQMLSALQGATDRLLERIDGAEGRRGDRARQVDDRMAEVAAAVRVLSERVNGVIGRPAPQVPTWIAPRSHEGRP